MTRLPPAKPESDPALAPVYDEITQTRGFVSNALRSIGHAPEGLKHLARLGAYVKYESDLPERLREFSFLCSARGVPYAWQHHSALALQAGIPQTAIDDIASGRIPAALSPAEQAIARYVSELFGPPYVSDAAMEKMRKHYSPRQITDISLSATYYRALGTMVMAFRVEMEGADVLEKERAWQKVHIEQERR